MTNELCTCTGPTNGARSGSRADEANTSSASQPAAASTRSSSACRSTLRLAPPQRREVLAGRFDVAADLRREVHDAGEDPLLAQPAVEAQRHHLAVDVAREVEDVTLDDAVEVFVDGGPRADVGGGVEGRREPRQLHARGVDAVARHQRVLDLQIDRRPAEFLPHAVTAQHLAHHLVRAAEHRVRVLDAAVEQRGADAGARHPFALPLHLLDAVDREAQLLAGLAQQRHVALALPAEAEALADVDLAHGQLLAEKPAPTPPRRPRRDGGEKGEDEQEVAPRRSDQPLLLLARGEPRRRLARA